MTIMEIIRSEHYYLVEALEHIEPGHELFQQIKNELFKKTGYTWISQKNGKPVLKLGWLMVRQIDDIIKRQNQKPYLQRPCHLLK